MKKKKKTEWGNLNGKIPIFNEISSKYKKTKNPTGLHGVREKSNLTDRQPEGEIFPY